MRIYVSKHVDINIRKEERETREKLICCLKDYIKKEGLAYRDIFLKDIKINENGKPYLYNDEIFFSISHSKDIWICIVDVKKIGVDIEFWKNKSSEAIKKLAVRYFHKDEISLVEKYKEQMFYKIWTIKEAIVKLEGKNLLYTIGNRAVFLDEDSNIHIDKYYYKEINFNSVIGDEKKYTAVVVSEDSIENNIEIIEI